VADNNNKQQAAAKGWFLLQVFDSFVTGLGGY